MTLDWTLHLAKLVHARKTLIKHRDHLDPGRTKDFYQERVVQLTDEIYKIEAQAGVHTTPAVKHVFPACPNCGSHSLRCGCD